MVDTHLLRAQSGFNFEASIQTQKPSNLNTLNAIKNETHTLLTLLMSKCLSKGSCLILLGKLPSKLATTFQPKPWTSKVLQS